MLIGSSKLFGTPRQCGEWPDMSNETPFRVLARGMWSGSCSKQHCHDPSLCRELVQFFLDIKCPLLIDLGCGDGKYLKAMKDVGLNVIGVDGHPDTVELTGGLARVADLSEPLNPRPQYPWVLSLEVGEHIPVAFEQTYLDNVFLSAAHGVVLSWAVPGQGGAGHVNCQLNHYVVGQAQDRGFNRVLALTRYFRDKSTLPWFKNTIMVFVRHGQL